MKAEALAVLGGRDAEAAMKSAAEYLGAGKAGRVRDCFERRSAVLEQVARALDSQCLDVGGWGLADVAVERTGERALAHQRTFGEQRVGQFLFEVTGDPGLELAQLWPCGLLG